MTGFFVRNGRCASTAVTVVGLLALLGPPSALAQDPVADRIRSRIEQMQVTGVAEIGGESVSASPALIDLYSGREFRPLWLDGPTAADLDRAIMDSALDGLTPADYNLAGIRALVVEEGPSVRGDLDILRSEALLRLGHDLRYGKVRANDPGAGRDPTRPLFGTDPASDLVSIVESRELRQELERLRPTHFVYRGLVAALANLRRVEPLVDPEPIASGPAIRLNDVDSRIPAVRRRLSLLGDLDAASPADDPLALDVALERAVRRFQRRHALNEDGIVGPATLRELNVPIGTRIDQVRINLDRARWLTPDLPNTFVVVNIAGAMTYLVRDGSVVWESRAIVGATNTTTPTFQATMRYIDLNPTWTVPPGIVGEILAEVRRDADYLRRNAMRVIDHAGREVSISATELGRYTARTFPYLFRQDPGPANPLGRIKLMFPNPHNVYLHDTPARYLFDREDRTFSHGCIRLQDPIGLAVEVLDDPDRWSLATIEAAIKADGRTRTIPLTSPLPVLVYYWTAATDETGELHFYRDVYARDAALLRALGS